jgi:hypothetical protein
MILILKEDSDLLFFGIWIRIRIRIILQRKILKSDSDADGRFYKTILILKEDSNSLIFRLEKLIVKNEKWKMKKGIFLY